VESDSNTVRFVLDGQVVRVPDAVPTRTVLEFLRNDLGRTGTKEGCAEGDCGACTVVLGELAPGGRRIEYRAVNSCIRFLPTLDGKELVTVESLAAAGGSAHPVQQAMVDRHASQCGFCTPGFVMSLFALYLARPEPKRDDVVDALSGNLCRCTGYRPIIEAGCHMGEYAAPSKWSREDAQSAKRVELLRSIQRGTVDAAGAGVSSGARSASGGASAVLAMSAGAPPRGASLALPGYRAPRTVDELASALLTEPMSLILAGGTDVGLWVTQHLRDLPPIVYIGDVAELNTITTTRDGLRIGAAVPLSIAWPALVKAHPALAEQARRFASPPIQNSATLCGNIANGSPIGDSIPALIALGAHLELRKGTHTRTIALEDFYLAYQKKDLAPGEFVVSVTIPPAHPEILFASYKLAKRFDQDISAVCTAFAVTTQDGIVVDARLAFGGMAATPKRAPGAESALIGQPWSLESCEAAIGALADDFQPLTDMRASNDYRLQAAGNLLRRFYLQHSDEPAPFTVMGLAPVTT
jgi:xanthine dehydrogenase small subunit